MKQSTQKSHQKRQKIEFSSWVLSFFIEFDFFYPRVFSSMAKKQVCIKYKNVTIDVLLNAIENNYVTDTKNKLFC